MRAPLNATNRQSIPCAAAAGRPRDSFNRSRPSPNETTTVLAIPPWPAAGPSLVRPPPPSLETASPASSPARAKYLCDTSALVCYPLFINAVRATPRPSLSFRLNGNSRITVSNGLSLLGALGYCESVDHACSYPCPLTTIALLDRPRRCQPIGLSPAPPRSMPEYRRHAAVFTPSQYPGSKVETITSGSNSHTAHSASGSSGSAVTP